ncbi:MFS transporter [Falsiroseomonas oryziterrae]|uniref:MFS transporter n=1 Tax=Falsiroseomonas oryziterrae TaxID=2911368 RepID=UPI001F1BF1DA|nr:MFS transporter [Roseomonas sp. NPKOSM-4]
MTAVASVTLPILVLCLGHVFSNAVRTIPAIAADVLTRDLGISAETLAQLTGAFPLAFAAVMIPVGIALDRHGVKRVSLFLLTVAGCGAVMAALATGPWWMLLAQVVLGAGCSGMLMCPITFAARALTTARFATWSGIIQAVGNTGMLLSASPLALLIEATDWRAGYWACAVLAALAIVAVAAFVPAVRPEARPSRGFLHDSREVLAMAWQPKLRAVTVFVFASFAAVLGVRGLWGGPWLMEAKDLPRVEAGNILLACTVALTVGPALAGLVLRRFGRAGALLAGSHILAALLILLLIAGGPGGVASQAFGLAAMPAGYDLALLIGFGLAISFQVIGFSLVRAAVPAEQAGRALSAANLSFFLGAAVLQGLSGLMAGWGGVAAALSTFAGGLILCSIGFLVLRRQR